MKINKIIFMAKQKIERKLYFVQVLLFRDRHTGLNYYYPPIFAAVYDYSL